MKPDKEIQSVLETSRFAVLATQNEGQPHASLMAYTPMDGIQQLIVATYRATLKYRNLLKDGRVAILIDSRNVAAAGQQTRSCYNCPWYCFRIS